MNSIIFFNLPNTEIGSHRPKTTQGLTGESKVWVVVCLICLSPVMNDRLVQDVTPPLPPLCLSISIMVFILVSCTGLTPKQVEMLYKRMQSDYGHDVLQNNRVSQRGEDVIMFLSPVTNHLSFDTLDPTLKNVPSNSNSIFCLLTVFNWTHQSAKTLRPLKGDMSISALLGKSFLGGFCGVARCIILQGEPIRSIVIRWCSWSAA